MDVKVRTLVSVATTQAATAQKGADRPARKKPVTERSRRPTQIPKAVIPAR